MTTRYGDRVPKPTDHWVKDPKGGIHGGYVNCCDGSVENGCDAVRTREVRDNGN